MTKLPEPEDFATLRHRWARTIEVWVAYRTFLHREVQVGPDRICLTPLVVQQTTHTLLACYYSFLYSLFDPSGVNFKKVSKELLPNLPPPAVGVRDLILEHWAMIADPVTLIRHNIGFHGAPKRKGMKRGYAAYRSLHPQSSEYVMTLMRVFFRFVDEVYEGAERRMRPTAPGEIDALMAMARELRSEIEATPKRDTLDDLSKFFGWSNGSPSKGNGRSSSGSG
jgi:hypothetical protein